MNREDVFQEISLERKKQSIAGYLLVLEAELEEAKTGCMKNIEGNPL